MAASLAALATALGVAAPSASAGVAISTPDRCYVHWPGQGSQGIPVALSGLAPAQQVKVELRVEGVTVSGFPSLTADSTGSIVTKLDSWTSGLTAGPARGKQAQIVASDFILGTQLAAAPIHVGNVGLDIDTSRKRFGTKRRWEISGLSRLGGIPSYYAFYFKGTKMVGKQPLGRATDACGYLRTKRLLIPFMKVGKYELRVQASKRYRPSLPWIGGTVVQGRRKP